MKRNQVVMICVILAVSILQGCGVSTIYKLATTKDPAVCNRFETGKTTEEQVEKMLGEPVGIRMSAEGKIATYRAGYFMAKVTYESGVIRDFECTKQ